MTSATIFTRTRLRVQDLMTQRILTEADFVRWMALGE